MNIHETLETIKDNFQINTDLLEHAAALQAEKALAKQQVVLTSQVTAQARELQVLRRDVDILQRQRPSKGGFPWGLLLLTGGVYALYRSNPDVRDRIDGILKRLNPGLEGNLTRAGDAAKDAATEVIHGNDPSKALGRLGGEVQRAGEKATDQVKGKFAELKDDAQGGIDDLKRNTDQQLR